MEAASGKPGDPWCYITDKEVKYTPYEAEGSFGKTLCAS